MMEFDLEFPPKPEWQARMIGIPNTYWRSVSAPNWFHRLMQKWILGIVWERIEK